MGNRISARWKIARIIVVLFICAILFSILAPASMAGETRSVSVSVTISTCIQVSRDGTVRSNVSTTSLESPEMVTYIAL